MSIFRALIQTRKPSSAPEPSALQDVFLPVGIVECLQEQWLLPRSRCSSAGGWCVTLAPRLTALFPFPG